MLVVDVVIAVVYEGDCVGLRVRALKDIELGDNIVLRRGRAVVLRPFDGIATPALRIGDQANSCCVTHARKLGVEQSSARSYLADGAHT